MKKWIALAAIALMCTSAVQQPQPEIAHEVRIIMLEDGRMMMGHTPHTPCDVVDMMIERSLQVHKQQIKN